MCTSSTATPAAQGRLAVRRRTRGTRGRSQPLSAGGERARADLRDEAGIALDRARRAAPRCPRGTRRGPAAALTTSSAVTRFVPDVQRDDSAAEERDSARPRTRRARTARRDRRAPGSGGRSREGTCTPCRREAPSRRAERARRTRAGRTASEGPRGRVISSTASLPPGRSTRRELAQARLEVGEVAHAEARRSRRRTRRPRTGSASASPCTHSIAPDFRRARSSMRSEKSSPTTAPPRRSASTARSPVPQHASSTRSPGHTTSLYGEPPPAAVEPGRHDVVHDVVDRRDAVEHAAHGLGLERPGLVGHRASRPSGVTSALSIPIWSRQRATTKSTRSSIVSAPW